MAMFRSAISRKLATTLPAALLLVTSASVNAAIDFNFEGSANGGTGSATLGFNSPAGDTLTIDIANTSSIYLDDGSEWNAPGITAFGFDLDLTPDSASVLGWSMIAQHWDADAEVFTTRTIGNDADNCDGGPCRWSLNFNDSIGNLTFEYLPDTDNGVKGALYNPDSIVTGAHGSTPFFTDAHLLLTFSESLTNAIPSNTLVRMQNVGANGAGSLKLTCEDGQPGCGDEPPGEVPEPATLALIAMGLAGIRLRKRAFGKS